MALASIACLICSACQSRSSVPADERASAGAGRDPQVAQRGQPIAGLRIEVRGEDLSHIPDGRLFLVDGTNTRTDTMTLENGGCSVLIDVARDSVGAAPVWQPDRARPRLLCAMYSVTQSIGPGSSRTIGHATLRSATVLGDSLPEGRYYFVARLWFNGQRWSVPAGSAILRRK